MDDDELRYLSWTWTGPLLLVVGVAGLLLFGCGLVVAVGHGSVMGALGWGALTLASVGNLRQAVLLLRRRRHP